MSKLEIPTLKLTYLSEENFLKKWGRELSLFLPSPLGKGWQWPFLSAFMPKPKQIGG